MIRPGMYSDQSGWRNPFTYWTFFLLCSAALVLCFYELLAETNLSRNGVLAQGTVVNVEEETCKHGSQYDYTIRFVDRAGHLQIASYYDFCGGQRPPNPSLGSTETIVYLPDNPTIIQPPEDVSDLSLLAEVLSIIFGLGDLLLLLVSVKLTIGWRRKRNEFRQRYPTFP
jgi:Protein of unknown function (DUF3592)